MITPVLLYKALTLGQRVVSHLFRGEHGTIVRRGLPESDAPDWYQVKFDRWPERRMDSHRSSFKPLRTADRHRRLIKVALALTCVCSPLAARAASPVEIVAAVIVAEAGGEGVAGMRAVREVIQMRAYERRQTEQAVVTAPRQFSCLNRVTPARLVADAKAHPAWNAALTLASRPAAVATVRQANHYHAVTVRPAWASGVRPVARVGWHIFYRL